MLTRRYVGFALDQINYALALVSVERVIHAVAVTPLPDAPEVILGVINIQGRIVPVADIRSRFGLVARGIECRDRMVIARSSERTVALIVDAVIGVLEYSEADIVSADSVLPEMEFVEGIARTADGVVLIHDLDRLLSLGEQRSLRRALGDD